MGASLKYGEHSFPSSFGFTGSAGKLPVAPHMRSPASRPPKIPKDFARAVKEPGGFARGGEVEGSAEDRREDRREAKKRGMSLKAWEGSEADKKQDARLARKR